MESFRIQNYPFEFPRRDIVQCPLKVLSRRLGRRAIIGGKIALDQLDEAIEVLDRNLNQNTLRSVAREKKAIPGIGHGSKKGREGGSYCLILPIEIIHIAIQDLYK